MPEVIIAVVAIIVVLVIVLVGVYVAFSSPQEDPIMPPTGTPDTTPPAPYADNYRKIAASDITRGVDQWVQRGTLEDCARKCSTTPGCVGFTRGGDRCWGKTSTNVVPGGSTVYLSKSV